MLSRGLSEIEELEEESKEEFEGASTVSIIEAGSSASTLIWVSFCKPWMAMGAAGGAAVELMVSAKEATESVLEARSVSLTLTGAQLDEPGIAVEAGVCPAPKVMTDGSSVTMEGRLALV